MKNKIIIFNPRSANAKHRIPNSILQVGASIHGKFEYVFVDGNLEKDPFETIENYFKTGEFKYFCSTVMPGPQLQQAIPFTKKIKEQFPDSITVWGGYFAANQYKVSINSGYVDYIVTGPGDVAFPSLIGALEENNVEEIPKIKNLIYLEENKTITKTAKEALLNQDKLPDLPYEYLNEFYPLEGYLSKTCMGNKTFSYHSSIGCPFSCSFCAVVPIYNARWQGKSAESIYKDVKFFKDKYGIDAIEFHDNNFFTSRKRVMAFCELVKDDGIQWWGEGRIDTLNKYSDEELQLMREAGCKMIFLGAETGNDEVLKQMNKGGTQTGAMIEEFVLRMRNADIIPELSFVLGLPLETEQKVFDQINWDINFIKKIKKINPEAEIIIYLYSPVPTEGSELYKTITEAGFNFPERLKDWISPVWENFDLRKNPLTPWLTPRMISRIKNFETVLNGVFPTVSDFRITKFKRAIVRTTAVTRYKLGWYAYPYEIKVWLRLWKYRQPEIEGFYTE